MKKNILLIVTLLTISFTLNAEEVSSFNLDGNAKNSISSGYNGIIKGNYVKPTKNRHSTSNKAMMFGGGRIEVNNMQGFDFGDNFSVSMWIWRNNIYGWVGLISNGFLNNDNNKTFEIIMKPNNGGKLLVTNVYGKTGSQHDETILPNNYWHHIVLTSTPYESKLYVDNHLVHNNLVNRGETIIGQKSLLIGATGKKGNPGMYNFNGRIDDVKIYNHILSEEEVATLYKQ